MRTSYFRSSSGARVAARRCERRLHSLHVNAVNIKVDDGDFERQALRSFVSAAQPVKDRYHHGNLRPALIDAAVALIEEQGVGALTLREVARRAGVTHAAPYRHFADKSAILAAVAAEGFRALAAGAEREMARETSARRRFLRSGVAYVMFAVQHPAHFRVMFGPDRAAAQDPTRCEASGDAFQQLLDCVVACQKDGVIRRGDPMSSALVAWAFVHGLASLLVDEQLPPMDDIEAFVERSVQSFSDGLAPRRRAARATVRTRPRKGAGAQRGRIAARR